jgi:hypothetical protein
MQTRKKRASSEIAIDLQIGGELRHRVASLANSGPDDRHFVLTTDESGATTVRFGDGAHGAPAGADAVGGLPASKRALLQSYATGTRHRRRLARHFPAASDRLYGVYRAVVTNNVDPWDSRRRRLPGCWETAIWACGRPVGSEHFCCEHKRE